MAGLKQPRNERCHNGIGEIRDDLPGPLPHERAEVEVPGISPDERHVRLALEEVLQDLKEPWIDLDRDNLRAKILSDPQRQDIAQPIQEQLIVELYSK